MSRVTPIAAIAVCAVVVLCAATRDAGAATTVSIHTDDGVTLAGAWDAQVPAAPAVLLVHSYMLGPDGASNGCVSIRNYERFLKAYGDGEVTRLVVVHSLTDSITASRRTAAPS
jgi:hypothetical protein